MGGVLILGERIRQMEVDLERIAGVRSVRMRVEEGEISEVHIVADPSRRPKWIARDVITTLFARHGVRIPHQRISVAASAPAKGEIRSLDRPAREVRVAAVQVSREGELFRASVELREGEKTARAGAEAIATKANRLRVVAAAALDAVRKLTGSVLPLHLEETREIRIGRLPVAVTHVVVLYPDGERSLVGCAPAEDGRPEAIACAVVDAVLRAAPSSVPPREDEVEYEVREEGEDRE